MYRAKEFGRNNFQFYSDDMNAVIAERLELQNMLRRALDNGQLALVYQPKVDLVSGQITGMEALLRIKNGENGMLMPQNFIRVAEETGLIVPIGEWVMREACRYAKSLHNRGLPLMRVAVNLSARQLTRYELVRAVEQALRDADLAAEFLELELTESMVMHDPEAGIATLEELKVLGVLLSIDDFGTGHSSLSYLKRFPVDVLKIDQSFVRDLDVGKDRACVKAIITIGHNLDMKVIAEGVETPEQLSFLLTNECDAIQGFLVSPPLSSDDFTKLLERESDGSHNVSILKRLCPSYYSEQSPIRDIAHVTAS
jgi:EAL domain-containing protein (putative c-di-GMP-specific phosphodiesterase class I)